jgi:hypothetical protein
VSEPVGRAGGEATEEGKPAAQAVEGAQRGVGIRQADVHMQRRLGGAQDQSAHLLEDVAVALGVDEPHLVTWGGGVETGADQRRTGLARRGAAESQLGGCV